MIEANMKLTKKSHTNPIFFLYLIVVKHYNFLKSSFLYFKFQEPLKSHKLHSKFTIHRWYNTI